MMISVGQVLSAPVRRAFFRLMRFKKENKKNYKKRIYFCFLNAYDIKNTTISTAIFVF